MRICFLALLFLSNLLMAQNQEKILFVGNSFTFYWNLPSQVEQMAKQQQIQWEITQSTAGGATLRDHWQGNKELKTKALLLKNKYDRVIFQEQSTYPIKYKDTTEFYFSKLKSLLPPETKVLLYATWNYPNFPVEVDPPNDSKKLELHLEDIATNAQEVTLIPVGRAFDLFTATYPEIQLLTDDDKHPSPNGTYLAACVIYATLSGNSAIGLDRRYEGKDANGKKIFYSIVENRVVTKCQQIADQIVLGQKQ